MKKQGRIDFAPELKVEDFPTTSKFQTLESPNQPGEEPENSDTEYTQSDETLDMAILQELVRDGEKSLDLLIKDNDRAVDFILRGELPNALSILEKMEKLMEYLAMNGRILDRNIIITCLYNIAAAHQASWQLAKCAKYIEAVTYNLAQSISHDDGCVNSLLQKSIADSQIYTLKAITLRKRQFLVKVYLQYCAVTSQLNKHEEALVVGQKSQEVMRSVLNECLQFCRENNKDVEFENKNLQTPQKNTDRSRMTTTSGASIDIRKNLLNDITFRDEVYYNKQIIESAIPFLEDFLKNTLEFSRGKMDEIISQTRSLLFNWKNNPENNEKYIRKELTKDKFPPKIAEENRTLLGVQQDPEWLNTLNIGSIMHMRPLKYKDYAQKREFINELTKTSLQEKAIFQSLTFFTLATEMRFMEISKETKSPDKDCKEEYKTHPNYRPSEAYHLKAIEIVCRYITGHCPYINHLITSYQKHYGQDLETIPEESINSFSESTASQNRLKEERFHVVKIKPELSGQELSTKPQPVAKKTKKVASSRERGKGLYEASALMAMPIDEEKYKEMRRDRKKDSFKSLNLRTKKLSNKLDEHRKAYTSNLSLSSPTRNSKTEFTTFSPKLYKTSNRSDTETLESLDEKYSSNKRSPNVPTLGLHNVLREVAPQSITNKPNQNEAAGYQSERVIPGHDVDILSHFNSSEPERKPKGKLQNEANFYLYKNFNKFIQNFYVKNDQSLQQKALGSKIKDIYLKHPYTKDITTPKTKKVVGPKKGSSTTFISSSNVKSPVHKKKSDLSPQQKPQINEIIAKIENKRPKTASKRGPSLEGGGPNHIRGNSGSLRLNERSTKSLGNKEFDFLRRAMNIKK